MINNATRWSRPRVKEGCKPSIASKSSDRGNIYCYWSLTLYVHLAPLTYSTLYSTRYGTEH
jgi:hypothetical protein